MTPRRFANALALLLVCAHVGLPSTVRAQPGSDAIVIGERLKLESAVLEETRPLLIAKPDGYETGTEHYPVLYLLDGDAHFHHTTGMVSFLADSGRIPPMLVVAIPNNSRSRDFTPPTQSEMDIRFTPISGGADNFLRFLSDELMPYVERTYRTRPYRILVGHSLGGLFALHALVTRPELFNSYIAIDPSLQWNDQALVSQADVFFKKTRELNADLYMTGTSGGGLSLGGLRKLAGVLEEKVPEGFRWRLQLLPEEDHVSTPHLSTYYALDTIFDGWHLADPFGLYEKGGLAAIHRHFEEGGKRFGYERETSPFMISMVVHGLLQAGRLEEAATVLLHDRQRYPPPWNQLDALARRYAERGDTERVIHYYMLSLRENLLNNWARKKLTELGVDVDAALARPAE